MVYSENKLGNGSFDRLFGVILFLSLAISCSINYWFLNNVYPFATLIGWLLIVIYAYISRSVRLYAIGKNQNEFLKLSVGYNGLKMLLTLIIIGVVLYTKIVMAVPFLITIFITFTLYIFSDLFLIIKNISVNDP